MMITRRVGMFLQFNNSPFKMQKNADQDPNGLVESILANLAFLAYYGVGYSPKEEKDSQRSDL
jgi:hypothetical protein